jgi:response regulator RpfG family c-di-GMP phosphodiesterase
VGRGGGPPRRHLKRAVRGPITSAMSAVAFAPERRTQPADVARVLCVDDEPHVLEGLRDSLRRSFDVRVAESGGEGLALLEQDPEGYAVVISDMRMPGMSGAQFLAQARRMAPNAVRLLLTGHADLDAAVAAVNDGQLFRFLTKPCPREELLRACAAALGQHRLLVAERVLLEQTLRGSIGALVDVLALTNPAAFGRAMRLRSGVKLLAERTDMPDVWEVEIAAMLLQLGAVTLPDATAERLYAGAVLSEEEQAMVDAVPAATQRILGHVPRLEGVQQILADVGRPFRADGAPPSPGARMLRIVADYDDLESRGTTRPAVLATMRNRSGVYDPRLLDAYALAHGPSEPVEEVAEVRLVELRPGMVLADDVRHRNGSLLISRGYRVTAALIERLEHLPRGDVREPLRVIDEPVED